MITCNLCGTLTSDFYPGNAVCKPCYIARVRMLAAAAYVLQTANVLVDAFGEIETE